MGQEYFKEANPHKNNKLFNIFYDDLLILYFFIKFNYILDNKI